MQTEGSPDFSKQVDAGLVFQTLDERGAECARGATRGPLDVLDVRSSTEIRALLRDQKETSRGNAARLPNTTALLSHTKRSTRRARTAVVTEEPKLSAAHAGKPSPAEHS